MKFLLPIFGFTLLTFFSASAQVSVDVALDQNEFLPGEAMPLAVRVTNRSGQPLHLGADPAWLTFSVESQDGFIVFKKSEVPVLGEFTVGSSQVAIKRVNLEPYFVLTRPGRYHVVATVRIKDWNIAIASPPKNFDIISGAKLWSQNFGVPDGGVTNRPPEVRKYILEEANYLSSQLRLYVQVTDESGSHVFKVAPIGRLVSFSQPETQLDRFSNLHVLWQSGAADFTYAIVNPNGKILDQEIYDYVTSRPRLNMNEIGDVLVVGGVRRIKPGEIPQIETPDELPAPAKP
ncbi:MAG: hypothetical protein ACREFE_11470 [Limisphaerales bacterium]